MRLLLALFLSLLCVLASGNCFAQEIDSKGRILPQKGTVDYQAEMCRLAYARNIPNMDVYIVRTQTGSRRDLFVCPSCEKQNQHPLTFEKMTVKATRKDGHIHFETDGDSVTYDYVPSVYDEMFPSGTNEVTYSRYRPIYFSKDVDGVGTRIGVPFLDRHFSTKRTEEYLDFLRSSGCKFTIAPSTPDFLHIRDAKGKNCVGRMTALFYGRERHLGAEALAKLDQEVKKPFIDYYQSCYRQLNVPEKANSWWDNFISLFESGGKAIDEKSVNQSRTKEVKTKMAPSSISDKANSGAAR